MSVTGDGRWFHTNVQRAGELFMYSLWIQGQMADLTTFARSPDLITPFLENPAVMPREFVLQRAEAWQHDFGPTKNAFVDTFRVSLDEQDMADLEFLYTLRNAIAHSHVSVGRDYFLYRPHTWREEQVIDALELQPREDSMVPTMVKLAFFDDQYYVDCFARIKRLDEHCFARIADELGVKHGRIR